MPCNNATNILTNLPVELLIKILRELYFEDILTGRLVCKSFRSLIDNFLNFKCLVLSYSRCEVNKKNFFKNEQLNCFPFIRIKKLRLTSQTLRNGLFLNLKQLYIQDTSSFRTGELCNFLNSFRNSLKHLEVSNFQLKTRSVLTLPNLEILSILNIYGDLLVLDTSNLSKFKLMTTCHNPNIEFRYAEKIEHCELFYYNDFIKNFINLKSLFCNTILIVENNLLSSLPKLEEIQMKGEFHSYFSLKKQKEFLRNDKLKIFLKGINFPHRADDFARFSLRTSWFYDTQLTEECIQMFIKHHDHLSDQLPNILTLSYAFVADHFHKLPKNFFNRLISLELVSIPYIKDREKLEMFLKQCKSVSSFCFDNSSLDQDFYDLVLPSLCPFIGYLNIKDKKNIISQLDLEFIFKFTFLNKFITNKNLKLEFVKEICTRIRMLEELGFHYKGKPITLQIFKDKIILIYGDIKKFDNYDDLFVFIKSI